MNGRKAKEIRRLTSRYSIEHAHPFPKKLNRSVKRSFISLPWTEKSTRNVQNIVQ